MRARTFSTSPLRRCWWTSCSSTTTPSSCSLRPAPQ
eukprot:jgi/Chlat1/5594/Chrsp369S05372